MWVVRLNGGYFKKGYINIAGLDLDPSTPLKKMLGNLRALSRIIFSLIK